MSERRGPSPVVVLALIAFPVMLGGWFAYETFRPRHPLDVLFHRVIREASLSGAYSAAGWQRLDVSAQICPRVDRLSLATLELDEGYYQGEVAPEDEKYGLLDNADVWQVNEDKNVFALCTDHSFRALKIQIQRGTDQCMAHVIDLPACDP
ncbi:MAG: hypothetical protein EOP22_10450 [Hyphomicrobiales bacterium]|nr:MAG: hypothetical protein EOP22_10450 [Hyphomicrobiales bacterium]